MSDIVSEINLFGAKVQALLSAILPIKSLSALVVAIIAQIIPRSIYSLTLNAAIHVVALIEQFNARLAASGEQGTPLGVCGLAVQATLETAVETGAGSAVVKALPDIIAEVQTFIASLTPAAVTTASGKAVAIHVVTVEAAQRLADAQAAALATYLPGATTDPSQTGTGGGDFTSTGPGEPAS